MARLKELCSQFSVKTALMILLDDELSTLASWDVRRPTTQISSPPQNRSADRRRCVRGILQSIKISLTFFLPLIPSGWMRSPGRNVRTCHGKGTRSLSK